LKTLPSRIETLSKEIAALQGKLGDPALFAQDRAAFDKASAAVARKAGELEAAETEWLDLEILREEIG
jgi:ATP-binding cassette subfamily F protein uup